MKLIDFIIIKIIRIYQIIISPHIGNNCRYRPTCSDYIIISIRKWGIFKSIFMIIIRIMKCNPLGGYGYDPPK
ncbi:membrane protein insertion efficiency factor YidD [Blattabacterium cuenoti]|uniref:membrane protein insertion efficiency factor YidD n=1 Tax=Blattabacterium cuenoti TaxID=1653831 RepID=UPI00163C0F3A|nr:membrane protein insertion efficiency factor YidD [Blattabacterium cuenoti]